MKALSSSDEGASLQPSRWWWRVHLAIGFITALPYVAMWWWIMGCCVAHTTVPLNTGGGL